MAVSPGLNMLIEWRSAELTEKLHRLIVLSVLGLLGSGCAGLPWGAGAQDKPDSQKRAMNQSVEAGVAGYSAADEAVYERRFQELMSRLGSGGLAKYDTLAAVTGASTFTPTPRADAALETDPRIAEAIDYVKERNSSAFIIYKSGEVVVERYFGDVDKDTLLNSKSLAKPLSVVAVGRAVADRKIDNLDVFAATYFNEWADKPQADIRVRHLLEMRSGLLPQGFSPSPDDILNRAYLHPRHIDVILDDYPMTDKPGERYEYSNANAELVAPLIERSTGVRYEKWVGQEVLEKIGAKGGSIWLNREGGDAHSGCCIQLPADSWLRLAILVMNEGKWDGERLLPRSFVDAMKAPTPQNPFVGMALYVGSEFAEYRGAANPDSQAPATFHSAPYIDEDILLFDGNSNQVVYIIPSKDLIILRMGATPPKDKPWDNAYLPNLLSAVFDE